MTLSAIVLAGGNARRLGGASKPDLIVGEDTLLDLTLAACAAVQASPVVVVGPDSLARDGILVTSEDPPGGGPAAGVAAGLESLASLVGDADGFDPEDLILCLACDMPNAADAVQALVEAATARVSEDEDSTMDGRTVDGAWVVDDIGRHQPLLAVYRAQSLMHAVKALPQLTGASMSDLTYELVMAPVLGLHGVSDDIDTWQDADRWGARPWPSRLGEES
ncbi:molybdenum cofactor guanylyltransferase [Demequina aurantiaca]|uniref:molybdenum cofactor guanylyltransferase n=1 Tax=Demequina aurantiaca TaxID=676200 RepID=UPI003D337342